MGSGHRRRVRAAVEPIPPRVPVHDCKAPGGIMECHPASTTADQRHFTYRLAFFLNYKFVGFFLSGRVKVSFIQWGT